ncbi:hypothetical protein G9A89_002686 [Geosiphon pyriformis]|nr:hypothetical protein G9A89_002686 [Geosiphon pyriformis]
MSRPYNSPSRQPPQGGYPVPQEYHSSNGPPSHGPGIQMKVGRCPNNDLAKTNYLFVSPRDFDSNVLYVIVNGEHVFTIKPDDGVASRTIGTSLLHRRWAFLSLNQDIMVAPYKPEGPNIFLGRIDLEVGFMQKVREVKEQFDIEEMSNIFIQGFNNQIFSIGQILFFDFHGNNLQVIVKNIQPVDLAGLEKGLQQDEAFESRNQQTIRGILMPASSIHWSKAADSSIRLRGSSKSSVSNVIIQPNFKFEDMGIGGLDNEFSNIFRRAFASRILPPSLVEKVGIQHVKGLLLFGPPGTGKTLMARQIGKMLNAREPQIVNGPEILDKYVGQSEANIRKLFAEAEKEYKAKGEDSGLHIIIFDELDAICKQRGGKSDGTGVGDSVVNQLLAKMDGVEQLNNILIIGMTNRLDMIDEALLRPGRLEVHMEIGLPDEQGRLQILKIHTSRMRQNNIMGDDVDLVELANQTKNFSGAEINGLVKSASSFAFNRHIKVGTLAGVTPDVENIKVNRQDFLAALDEIHPAFGVNEEELQQCVQNSIIQFTPIIERILLDGQLFIEQVKKSERTSLVSVLLYGPAGSGKTALAATMAMSSEFPFIKLISPETMVGFSESAKMAAINKVFNDSYKSPLSVIVVDNIERLLDWVPIGPRFSNSVLQTLLVLLKKRPPKGRRLLLLATTTERSVLNQMDMIDAFNSEIYVPNITDLRSVEVVLKELDLFDDKERKRTLSNLQQEGIDQKLSIGIKKLLTIAEMCRQDFDKVDKFVNTLMGL